MNAYKLIKIDGKPISEHRYVIQQFLNRKLLTDEVIHHKNLVKNDNRIENLVIMTKAEHSRLHSKLPRHYKSNDITIIPMKMYITIKDVMLKYGVERYPVSKWIKQGMPSYKVGSVIRLNEAEVDKWINEQ